MTGEEAIKNIKEHCYFANLIPQAKEALDMAIKALEQEPCEDCVNRQAVIDIVTAECVDLQDGSELWRSCVNDTVESIYLKVEDLPPVIPQPQPNIKAESEDKE